MRIGIVNDVALAVEAMRRVVLSTGEHQLVWIARDGAQAVEFCARSRPDLVLMDLLMPGMAGVEATRRIMGANPCPIVVVTADVRHNCSMVFEAMGAGALDAVNTPVLERLGTCKGSDALLAKIETIRKLIGAGPGDGPPRSANRTPCRAGQCRSWLVGIGASAGGPAALATLLGSLPGDFPAAIVIVQHVDEHFAQGLATWLDFHTALRVRVAREGDAPQPGAALIAGGERHLVLSNRGRLGYLLEPTDCSYRPSIDVFFKSLDRHWPGELVGVLLTGMGRDGAEGLRLLRHHGRYTIAQDQGSSAVYGMPKAAAELAAASEILPLNQISPRLLHLLAPKRDRHA